jgi:hypothetical protein
MKLLWASLFALLIVSCATPQIVPTTPPLHISMLPDEIDLSKIVPEPPATVKPNPKATNFSDVPVLGGMYCKDSKDKATCLDTGILVSETAFTNIIADKSTLKRTTREFDILQTLRSQERNYVKQGELIYQNRIVELQNENMKLKNPGFWDNCKPYVAFFVGVGLTVATVYAVNKASK